MYIWIYVSSVLLFLVETFLRLYFTVLLALYCTLIWTKSNYKVQTMSYTVECTVYTLNFTVHEIDYALIILYCAMCIVQYCINTVNCTLYNLIVRHLGLEINQRI